MPKFFDELGEASLENLVSDPSNLPEGRVWKNSTSQLPKIAIGGAVKELVTNDGTQALSNKTISGASNTITNVSGSNVVNTPSGNLAATDVQAALNELQSDVDTRATSAALSAHTGLSSGVHGVIGSVVGTSDAQVLTNKDIDGGTAANTRRITVPKDTKANLDALTRKQATVVFGTDTSKLYVDDGSNLLPVGSGSGLKNYFTDGDAEGANPFTFFNDGSAIWVDGTGGSPTATITQSATNPLSGQKSFLFTSGTQYDTAKASITIDREDKYKVQTLEISYEVASGTYASGDLQLFLYDSTNGAILYASPVSDIAASGINAKMQFAFQATDSLTYQILIHQKTSATFTMKFEMKIGPQFQAGYAPIFTDPVSFDTSVGTWLKAVTSDPTSYGTIVRNVGMMSRHGGKMNYTWQFEQSSAGSGGSGTYLLKLPYKIDLSKYGLSQSYVDTSFNLEVLAEGELFAYYNNGSDSGVAAHLYIYDESTLYAAIKSNSGTYNFWSSSFFELTASGTMSYNMWVNIWTLGQSAESKVISEYDGRVVAATVRANATLSVTADTTINYPTVIKDTHGMYSSGEFTIKIAGRYEAKVRQHIATTNTSFYMRLYKNGTLLEPIGHTPSNSHFVNSSYEFDAGVGDVITFRSNTTLTLDYSSGLYAPEVQLSLLSGRHQISAGERVFAKYKLASDTAISANDPLPNDTKVKDTHGAYNTTTKKFVVPVNGDYRITANAYQSGGAVGISVYADRNGTDEGIILHYNSSYFPANGSMVITDCVVGDELSAKADGATTLDAVNNGHQCTWITFEKLN